MNEFEIFYPFKPFVITQHWGNSNPAYATQFGNPNFKLHNGTDANVGKTGDIKYQTQFPVYCPVRGFRVHQVRYYPEGGGNEVWLISKEKYHIFEKECHVLLVLAHAKKVLVQAGDEPELGELLMIANNTGFSTGPHTHFGMYRVNYDGKTYSTLDENEANNSFSPELFFSGEYAVDRATTATLIKSGLRLAGFYLFG